MTMKEQLQAVMKNAEVLEREPLMNHTTFKIGGPADYLVQPSDAEELAAGIAFCQAHDIDFYVIGNGSNLLAGDGGFRGVIFKLCRNLDALSFEENDGELTVRAGAGYMLARLAKEVSAKGYTGFEFATGIPGTLGGGVTMNAGAYGGEINDIIVSATVMDMKGCIREVAASDLHLAYRHSIVMEEDLLILDTVLRFKAGDAEAIAERVAELATQRKEKQPLEYPSAGSTFKRPEGYFAGKLIQDADLKGYTVGGAQVSTKHSGFVINIGGATAADVRTLMQDVDAKVFEMFGVHMEPEVRFLGEF